MDVTSQISGKSYKTVIIGNQEWMAENLDIQIPGSVDNGKYGRLYSYEEALSLKLSDGWHLPSDDEWKTLEMALGMTQEEADKVGERGTDQGIQLKEGGSSGVNLQLGGYWNGSYYDVGLFGFYWLSTAFDLAWYRGVHSGMGIVYRDYWPKNYRYSVRLVRNIK